jgi:hypothetical protein
MNSDPASRPEKPKGEGRGRPNGGSGNLPQRAVRRRDAKGASNAPAEPTVGPEGSPGLRDRLLGEINELGSTDDAADWAHRSLRAKNTLRAADAECVEEAFAAKLVTLTGHAAEEPAIQRAASEQLTKAHLRDAHGRGRRPAASRSADRQNHTWAARTASGARPRSRQIGRQAGLSGLRPAACGRPPPALRAKPGAQP